MILVSSAAKYRFGMAGVGASNEQHAKEEDAGVRLATLWQEENPRPRSPKLSRESYAHEKGQCCEHWPKSLKNMVGTE
jgi:hypothetical protein